MSDKLRQSWQQILTSRDELQKTYSTINIRSNEGIALYGAGLTGLDAVNYLKNKKIKITCFIDSSEQKQGTVLAGIPIVSHDHPLAKSTSLALITTRSSISAISKQLQTNGFTSMSFLAFYVLDNLDTYSTIRNDTFVDELSRVCLDGLLLAMLTGQYKYCAEIMNETPYFCLPHFQNIGEEYFVDAGAYVGDTSERFIWSNTGLFRKIHAFEPGIAQFNALKIRMKRLIAEWALDPAKLSLINAGLGEHNGKACFGTSSSKLAATSIKNDSSTINNEFPEVPIWNLDSYLEQNQSPVTFIKADIEGMEMQMLRGACRSINRYKPKLAISIYHNLSDLFDIVAIVKSYAPEYNFSLRHHSSNLSETVLYCWVDSLT